LSRPRERGVALLGVVVALLALAVVATGLATTAAVDRHRTAIALESLQAGALARSAVTTAAVLLGDPARRGEPDSPRAAWAHRIGRHAVGPGWVEVVVEDEARRLDLNAPGADVVLERLLRGLALDPALAEALADWTDRDDVERPHGAERDWYRRRAPPLVPPNAPLTSVGELALLRGGNARALERLRPFVTVEAEPRLNPNTAPREVLEAWLGDPQRAQDLIARRAEVLVPCDDLPPCTTRAQHYTVRVTAGVGRVRRRVEAVVWAAGIGPRLTAWRELE
jgi:type II secretory pathway component PulK